MKKIIPNKALPYKILCGAAVLVFCLAACDDVDYSFSAGESRLICPLDSHDFMCPRASHRHCQNQAVSTPIETGWEPRHGRTLL